MAESLIRIEIKAGKNIPKVLKNIIREFQTRQKPHQEVGRLIVKNMKERFDKQVDPQGRPWDDLAESTVKAKESEVKLFVSGRLKGSIKFDVKAGGGPEKPVSGLRTFTIITAGSRTVSPRSIGIRAKVHQFGAPSDEIKSAGRAGEIPQREYLGLSQKDVEQVVEIYEKWGNRILVQNARSVR